MYQQTETDLLSNHPDPSGGNGAIGIALGIPLEVTGNYNEPTVVAKKPADLLGRHVLFKKPFL